jgi:protein TonB
VNEIAANNLSAGHYWPDTQARERSGPNVLVAALALAGLVHLVVIFGVTFEDIRERYIPPSLDVILIQQPNDDAAETASFLANHSQAGGGSSEVPKRQTSPGTDVDAEHGQAPKAVTAASPAATQEAASESITQIFSDHQIKETPEREQVNQVTNAPEAKALATQLEIARLRAELAQEMQALSNRPKTLYVTASTQKSTAANYMLEWVKKVERVGNLNYPSVAYRKSGSLVMVVGINRHGSLTEVAVKRSSGIDELDQAAMDIVKMAAPFDPMSSALAQETDVIYITRTWQFSQQNALSSY